MKRLTYSQRRTRLGYGLMALGLTAAVIWTALKFVSSKAQSISALLPLFPAFGVLIGQWFKVSHNGRLHGWDKLEPETISHGKLAAIAALLAVALIGAGSLLFMLASLRLPTLR